MNTASQESRILAYLQSGKSLTPLQALRLFGSLRLGARIYSLIQKGHHIHSELVRRNGKCYARYSLV